MAKNVSILGLDIGHQAVKAVCMERRGRNGVLTRAELLPLTGTHAERLDVLQKWLAQHGFRGAPCVIGISGQSTRFQPLILAPKDPRSLGQAVAMEVCKFNEMASESSIYGFAPLTESSPERRLLLAMARPAALEEVLVLPKAAGMEVVELYPLAGALFNGMGSAGLVTTLPCLYADIGHQTTEIAIGADSGMMFGRSFPIGGQMFTESLAKASGMTAAQAESFKITKGTLSAQEESGRVLRATADMWLAELRATLAIYRSSYPRETEQPRRMVLSGGGAELKNLTDYLADKSGMEVVCANRVPGADAQDQPGRFLLAAGLALSGLELGPSRISLLPRSIRDELILRGKKRYWIAAGIVAACILAVSLVGGYRDFLRMEKELRSQQASLQRCTALAREINATKAANAQILAMLQPLGGLLWNGCVFRELIPLVDQGKDPNDWISIISDARFYFKEPSPAAKRTDSGSGHVRRPALDPRANPAEATNTVFTRVIIEGYTPKKDLSSVKRLIEELSKSPLVQAADLLPDDELVGSGDDKDKEGSSRRSSGREKRFVIDVKVSAPRGLQP